MICVDLAGRTIMAWLQVPSSPESTGPSPTCRRSGPAPDLTCAVW